MDGSSAVNGMACNRGAADCLLTEATPEWDVVTEEATIDAALNDRSCGHRPIGTCAMGAADDEVVDPSRRVRGVDHSEVMDC